MDRQDLLGTPLIPHDDKLWPKAHRAYRRLFRAILEPENWLAKDGEEVDPMKFLLSIIGKEGLQEKDDKIPQ